MQLLHATCVEIDGHALLIRGPSGSGKSDLALRLIDGGAVLVADDQTQLSLQEGRLIASVPENIAGLLEVRGVGIVRLPHRAWAPVTLVVDLAQHKQIERLPEPMATMVFGVPVPKLDLVAFEASAAAKVRLAMQRATRDTMRL